MFRSFNYNYINQNHHYDSNKIHTSKTIHKSNRIYHHVPRLH